jgi:hypothetical protein
MSRNKDKITKALNNKNYTVENIYWKQNEGWNIETNEFCKIWSNLIIGYNVNEILKQIEELPVYKSNE